MLATQALTQLQSWLRKRLRILHALDRVGGICEELLDLTQDFLPLCSCLLEVLQQAQISAIAELDFGGAPNALVDARLERRHAAAD